MGLAVSGDGKYVASAGHDRSIRLWERTSEPLVLEDERETEREAEADLTLATDEDRVRPGMKADEEASMPSRKTVETERAAERIMEAIQVHKEMTPQLEEYREKLERHQLSGAKGSAPPAAPQLHPLMLAYNTSDPDKYLLLVLRQVKSSELEEALTVLPFDYVSSLLQLLEDMLSRGRETELVVRIVLFVVRLHHGPLSSTSALLPVLAQMKVNARNRIDQVRDRVGLNLAALHFMQREMEERQAVQLFSDASDRVKQRRKKRKNLAKATQRAVMTL